MSLTPTALKRATGRMSQDGTGRRNPDLACALKRQVPCGGKTATPTRVDHRAVSKPTKPVPGCANLRVQQHPANGRRPSRYPTLGIHDIDASGRTGMRAKALWSKRPNREQEQE